MLLLLPVMAITVDATASTPQAQVRGSKDVADSVLLIPLATSRGAGNGKELTLCSHVVGN